MIKILLLIIGVLTMTSSHGETSSKLQIPEENGVVINMGFGFEIRRAYPLSEKMIEEQARVTSSYVYENTRRIYYKISKDDLLTSIKNKNIDSVKYNKSNTRFKITFQGDDVYFIDVNGVGRHGNEYFEVDPAEFNKRLK